MDTIYLDHNATTPVDKGVVEKMLPYFTNGFGNPSSAHKKGEEASKAIELARTEFAKLIGAEPSEIIFTSGGTEADNIAIRGVCFKLAPEKNHIITSKIEHPAVLQTVEYLEKHHGAEVTYLDVDAGGRINLDDLTGAITEKTALVTIMTANNEVGTIQPMEEIGKICADKGVLFHTDAVQAVGKMSFDVNKFGISLAAFSAHKFYGPKGIGALYVRKGTKLEAQTTGGGQEKKLRPGTLNTPGIIGIGEAARLARENLDSHTKHVKGLRDYFVGRLKEEIPHLVFHGDPKHQLPQVASVGFSFVEGESILMFLDMDGNIQASSGSACSAGDLHASHVLLAMGVSHASANGTIRFSFGKDNTKEQVDKVMEVLPPIITRLRKMSPLAPKEE
ncbi:MAG: cysteine desulfurase family protein [Caldisericia bacterium]